MPDVFQLPNDGAIYTESIFSRCRDLVRYHIWSGIDLNCLDGWIQNFQSPEEKYFAARVLDTLIYRPDRQTIALMKQLFQRVLPDLARLSHIDTSLRGSYHALTDSATDPRVRIVPVIPPDAAPTKSGPLIARMLQRHLRFHTKWIMRPEEIISSPTQDITFVFVDDFLGTGEQFSQFLVTTDLQYHLANSSFVYAPLVAHVNGLRRLRASYPTLHICAVEVLEDRHSLFNPNADCFPDGTNSVSVAREFYYELLKKRKILIKGPERRGYGQLELTYAFQHAVPDNSLPIMWWHKSLEWQPLFKR